MTDNKEEPICVVITSPEGIESEYAQDTVIPFAGKQFAVLVEVLDEKDGDKEPDILLARIDIGENGEPEYVPPTDEEYDAVADIYNAM